MKHFNRLFTQRRIFWIFLAVMLVPNLFLCFTEHLPFLFKVVYILIPGALYLLLLNLSRKPGITFWARSKSIWDLSISRYPPSSWRPPVPWRSR